MTTLVVVTVAMVAMDVVDVDEDPLHPRDNRHVETIERDDLACGRDEIQGNFLEDTKFPLGVDMWLGSTRRMDDRRMQPALVAVEDRGKEVVARVRIPFEIDLAFADHPALRIDAGSWAIQTIQILGHEIPRSKRLGRHVVAAMLPWWSSMRGGGGRGEGAVMQRIVVTGAHLDIPFHAPVHSVSSFWRIVRWLLQLCATNQRKVLIVPGIALGHDRAEDVFVRRGHALEPNEGEEEEGERVR